MKMNYSETHYQLNFPPLMFTDFSLEPTRQKRASITLVPGLQLEGTEKHWVCQPTLNLSPYQHIHHCINIKKRPLLARKKWQQQLL